MFQDQIRALMEIDISNHRSPPEQINETISGLVARSIPMSYGDVLRGLGSKPNYREILKQWRYYYRYLRDHEDIKPLIDSNVFQVNDTELWISDLASNPELSSMVDRKTCEVKLSTPANEIDLGVKTSGQILGLVEAL